MDVRLPEGREAGANVAALGALGVALHALDQRQVLLEHAPPERDDAPALLGKGAGGLPPVVEAEVEPGTAMPVRQAQEVRQVIRSRRDECAREDPDREGARRMDIGARDARESGPERRRFRRRVSVLELASRGVGEEAAGRVIEAGMALHFPFHQLRVHEREVVVLDRAFHGCPDEVTRVVHICCSYPEYLDQPDPPKGPNGAYLELADALDASTVDAVSIEDAHRHNDLALLERFTATTVILGVVDIAKSRVESVDEVRTRLESALHHIDLARLMAAPDCGLGVLGPELARTKLHRLCQAAGTFS